MKSPAVFVLAAILAGCSKPTDTPETAKKSAPVPRSPEYPVLVIDEEHQIHGTNDAAYEISARLGVGIDATNFHFAHGTNTPSVYQIAATPGIRIDATKYQFTYGTNQFSPNMVQLFANDSLYRLSRET